MVANSSPRRPCFAIKPMTGYGDPVFKKDDKAAAQWHPARR